MMNARILSIFLLCFIITSDAIAGLKAETDSLLNELDNVISQRDIYNSRKESELAALRQKISEAADERERFFALGNLFRPTIHIARIRPIRSVCVRKPSPTEAVTTNLSSMRNSTRPTPWA